jgi:two-component system, NarL family, nitrate/nitrite response regulator NarL
VNRAAVFADAELSGSGGEPPSTVSGGHAAARDRGVVVGGFGGSLDIVLGDDQVVFLDALTMVLMQLGHHVVAATSTRAALLDSVRDFRPDLCVFEPRFPDGDGIGVIGAIGSVSPATRVVVLTAEDEPEPVRRALAAGAVGYLHKSRGVPALLTALQRVSSGEVVVEGSFSASQTASPGASQHLRQLATYLTPRELECLELLAAGAGTPAIARRLGVSTATIRSHVQAVLTKLGVHSRMEAASVAIRYGLVHADPHSQEVREGRSTARGYVAEPINEK